jgi:hypothetical protein
MFNEKEQDDRKTKKRVEDSILHPLFCLPIAGAALSVSASGFQNLGLQQAW